MVLFDGWYRIAFTLQIILVTIYMAVASLSPASTNFMDYYSQRFWIPFVMIIGLEFLVGLIKVTGVLGGGDKQFSLFPIGTHDEDTYIVQKLIGYNGAFAVFVIVSIVLGYFWFNTVATTHSVWIPVPDLLVEGLQTVSTSTRDFLSGHDAVGNALTNSLIPTFYENPTLIYSTFPIVWVIVTLILSIFGIPRWISSLVAGITWTLVAGVVFAFVAHSFVYEDVQPAYYKAFVFVASCALPTALTGFPVCDLPHIAHNFSASYYSVVSIGLVIPATATLGFLVFISNKSKKTLVLNTNKSKNNKRIMLNSHQLGQKLLFLVLSILILSIPVVSAQSLTDSINNFFTQIGDFFNNLFSTTKEKISSISGIRLSVAPGCDRLIIPTWGYYECKKSDNTIVQPDVSLTVSGALFQQRTGSISYSCSKFDVDPNGFNSQSPVTPSACRVSVTQFSSSTSAYQPTASNTRFSCSKGLCYGGTSSSGAVKSLTDKFYLQNGETITFTMDFKTILPPTPTYTLTVRPEYYQKVLIKQTWTGYKSSQFPGCDSNTVGIMSQSTTIAGGGTGIPNDKVDMFPQGQLTSLNIGNTYNFIDTYIDVIARGNYWYHQSYGNVICSVDYKLFKIESSGTATRDSQGQFTSGGTSYCTTSANPVSNCQCNEGTQHPTDPNQQCVQGFWKTTDIGICVKGGMANVQLCGQSPSVDLASGQKWDWYCNVNNGNCEKINIGSASCDPVTQRGCSGSQFCNAYFQCQDKPTTRTACPSEWCLGDPNYLDKSCSSSLKPCPTVSPTQGVCKTDCGGIIAPTCGNKVCDAGETPETCQSDCGRKPKPTDCWTLAESNKPIWDLVGITTLPAKAGCWIKEKTINLVIGVIGSIISLIFFTLKFGSPIIGLVLGLAVLLISVFWSYIIALIIILLAVVVGFII